MNRATLVRKLHSVGMRAFVVHFDVFRLYAFGQINRNRAMDKLVNLGVSNEAGAGIRVGNAKLIFEASREVDALNSVLESERMPSTVKYEAKRLKDELAHKGANGQLV